MTAQPSLFGTSGIRGDAEVLFTDQFCFDLGRTFARYLKSKGLDGDVAVGMDPRGSSPRIKQAVEKGLWYEKYEVYDQGATPVPSMCFVLQVNPSFTGSLMITGSHIKANLNGIKFFVNKEEILKKDEEEIQKLYFKLKEEIDHNIAPPAESHPDLKAAEEYKEMLLRLADGPYPAWKVVVDPGDGAQSDVMPQVLSALGIRVHELNTTIQGDFFARDTENEEDFAPLKRKVVETNSDFGVGFDSDGDRCIFVDHKGNFIPGDYTASIVAREAQTTDIVTTVATSQVAEYIGKKIYRTKVGSPYIISKMKETGAQFSFEPNGGGISAEIMFTRDGGSTTIKLLNILKKSGKTIEDLVSELPKFYLAKTKLDYKWEQKDEIIKRAKEKYSGNKIDETDGLKIWIDKTSWLMFRSSLNAPEFRIFAESKNSEKARSLLKEGEKLVREVIGI
jgi:phosphomannomutase / phosphoglucomutase